MLSTGLQVKSINNKFLLPSTNVIDLFKKQD